MLLFFSFFPLLSSLNLTFAELYFAVHAIKYQSGHFPLPALLSWSSRWSDPSKSGGSRGLFLSGQFIFLIILKCARPFTWYIPLNALEAYMKWSTEWTTLLVPTKDKYVCIKTKTKWKRERKRPKEKEVRQKVSTNTSIKAYLLILLWPISKQNSFALHVVVDEALQCRHVAFDDILNLQRIKETTSLQRFHHTHHKLNWHHEQILNFDIKLFLCIISLLLDLHVCMFEIIVLQKYCGWREMTCVQSNYEID